MERCLTFILFSPDTLQTISNDSPCKTSLTCEINSEIGYIGHFIHELKCFHIVEAQSGSRPGEWARNHQYFHVDKEVMSVC